MSDILTNAKLYNELNTKRVDTFTGDSNSPNQGFMTPDGKLGGDCSGFQKHVLHESGYNVPYLATSQVVDPNTNQLTPQGST